MNLEDATKLVDSKKSSQFGTPFGRPKKSQIHIHSVSLVYEPILMVSGSYSANYYRKTIHPIKVDNNVEEVVIGPDIFEVRKRSKLSKLVNSSGKRIIDLDLEEHVFVKNKGVLYLDHHGRRLEAMPYTIDSKSIESYGSKILAREKTREHEVEHDDAAIMLKRILKNMPKSKIKNLEEHFDLEKISMLYVPVYEARLVGPSKKIRIMRIDAARKKIL
ncbi:MAG: hypothetical protein K8823_592 [Cenarchaeum symbiont of Oopsacas minuta]|nr:hypothetical protein [Cenarchaeum symbiont of Oopsacas minuta]